MDLGAGVYTRQYFSSERYNIFEPSSRSHNLPIINGEYQFVGRAAEARDVVYEKGRFSMDIAAAYNTDAAKSIKRSFDMQDESVTLTDVFEVDEGAEVIERFVSLIEPKVVKAGEILVGDCRFTYYGDAVLNIGTEECSQGTCYLIDFKLGKNTKEFKVVME